MPSSRTRTEIKEGIAVQHRVALGLTALTLGAAALGLSLALLAAPGGVSNQLFQPTGTIVQTNSTADAVTVTWTAPGDDGSTGQAASYDLRYSTSQLTALNFASATRVLNVPPPAPAGSTESFTIGALSPDTTYFFALKTTDEAGNQSAISNVLMVTTSSVPQACIPVYGCSAWSACVNNVMTRTCSVTNGCPAGLGAPTTQQACTSPAPGTGGDSSVITNPMVVAGLAPGSRPKVRILNPTTLSLKKEFTAYSISNRNGVYVAAGDIDGDERAEVIVGTGAKSRSTVAVFTDAGKKITSFTPFGTRHTGGVTVATGDIDGDGRAEILTVPASSTGSLRAYRYDSTKKIAVLVGTIAPSASYRGGFNVAAADFDLNGRAEVVIARNAGSGGLSIYSWTGSRFTRTRSFSAYPIAFRSGIRVSTGDVTGDGRPEIVTVGGGGYWTDLKVFSSAGKKLTSVLPFAKSFFGGAALTTKDVNDDGQDEILVAPASQAAPFIRTFRYNQVTKKLDRIKTKNVFPATIRTGLRLGGA